MSDERKSELQSRIDSQGPPGSRTGNRLIDLKDDGVLWMINRLIFHPRGYAMGYSEETHLFYLYGDGTEPWSFDLDNEAELMEAFKRLCP